MKKRNTIQNDEDLKESLLAQFVSIYGIMIGIVFISVLALLSKRKTVEVSEIENVFVSAFVPTTITMFATALFEYRFIKENKMITSKFVLLTVLMSLIYTAFVCFEVILETSCVTTLAAISAGAITLYSFLTLKKKVSELGVRRKIRNRALSDGQIYANRR